MEIKNIKVTATYEEDEPSKFDALWKEYEIAKQIADTTEDTVRPLIEAAGEKKLELIYEQLEPIVHHVIDLANLHELDDLKKQSVCAVVYGDNAGKDRHSVEIHVSFNTKTGEWDTIIYFDGDKNKRNHWFGENGIITNWNSLKLYEKIKEGCEKELIERIGYLKKKTERIKNTFANMQNN